MTLSFLSFCHKLLANFILPPQKSRFPPRFHAKKNCLSQQGIQNPPKNPLFCPRIAQNAPEVYSTSEAKASALRCLKNESLKFFEFYFTKFDLFV